MSWTKFVLIVIILLLTLFLWILFWTGHLYFSVTATLAFRDSETQEPLAFESIYLDYDTGNVFRTKPYGKIGQFQLDSQGCTEIRIGKVYDTTIMIYRNGFIYRIPTKDLRRGKILNPPGKEGLGKRKKGESIPHLKIGVGSAIPDWCVL